MELSEAVHLMQRIDAAVGVDKYGSWVATDDGYTFSVMVERMSLGTQRWEFFTYSDGEQWLQEQGYDAA